MCWCASAFRSATAQRGAAMLAAGAAGVFGPGTDGSLLREAAGLKIGVDAYVYMLLASVTFQLIRASRSPRRERPAFTDDVLRSKKWRNPRIPAKSRCQALKSIAIDY